MRVSVQCIPYDNVQGAPSYLLQARNGADAVDDFSHFFFKPNHLCVEERNVIEVCVQRLRFTSGLRDFPDVRPGSSTGIRQPFDG